MNRESTFAVDGGGGLSICTDSPASACVDGEREYLLWSVGIGNMFGIAKNSPQLRAFLRRALRRLETDAKNKKR